MEKHKDIKIDGLHERPILLDVYHQPQDHPQPVIIFAHGFKGFKDWGHWHLIGEALAKKGFIFIKFNFSHNGTTPKNPTTFDDLEAFGQNNFSIELDDLGTVIQWVQSDDIPLSSSQIDKEEIYLIGHSRGGGTVLLGAAENDAVSKVATWASVADFGERWSEQVMEQWEKEGVRYIPNARTNQQMPMYYQIVEDYYNNIDRLHILNAVKKLSLPLLIVHGTEDEAVSIEEAERLAQNNDRAKLEKIPGAGHTFGGYHPYDKEQLPTASEQLVKTTASFFKNTS